MLKVIDTIYNSYSSNDLIITYENLIWNNQKLYLNIKDLLINHNIKYDPSINIAINIIFSDIIYWNNILVDLYKQMRFVIGDINLLGNNLEIKHNVSWLWVLNKKLEVSIYDKNDDTKYIIAVDIPWFFSSNDNWLSTDDIEWLVWIIKTIAKNKSYEFIQQLEKQIRVSLKENPILICECENKNITEKENIYWYGEIKRKEMWEEELQQYWDNIKWGWKDIIKLKLEMVNKRDNNVTTVKDITLNIMKYGYELDNTVNDTVKNTCYTKYEIPEISFKWDVHFDLNLEYSNTNNIGKISNVKKILKHLFK